MSTKFAIFCERVMEAGWLLATLSVPLFFDIYSSRVFEPDKITLLRSIALIIAFAWLARFIETGFADFRTGGRSALWRMQQANPLTIPMLLLVLIYLVSTIASVAQYVSIWGSYQRLQGTYSMFSYITIFGAMLYALRTRAQLERLLTVITITSLPIAAYGWLQHFRLDPLPWGGDVVERIASSMGNSIFVGAYLIMALPITLARWLNIVSQILRQPTTAQRDGEQAVENRPRSASKAGVAETSADSERFNDTPHLVLAGCYTFIIAFQALAIFWTFSRGAWIGLLAGLFVFLFLFGVRRRATWLWGGALTLAIAGVAFLLAINLPNTPFSSFKTIPGIGRLGTIFEEGGTNQVRFLIWEGAAQLIAPHEPIGFGPYTDVLNAIRPLIGYGPEAMYVAYNKFYPSDLAHLEARNASPDRSHNETFDALVTTGFIGFVIYLALFGSIFYYCFKWLGLAGERRDVYLFIACWVLGGALGAATAVYIEGTVRLVGVALPVGLLFGLLTYLISQALYFKRKQPLSPMSEDQILLMALIAAILGHFAEIHFGIAIAATRTYFWIYVALLVLIGYRLRQPVAAEAPVPLRVVKSEKMSERLAAIVPMRARLTPALGGVAPTGGTMLFARKRRRDKVSAGRNGGLTLVQPRPASMSAWTNAVIVYGLILGAMLQIMVFNFISPNFSGSGNNAWILALFVLTVIVATLTMTAQVQAQQGGAGGAAAWLNRYVLIAVIGISVAAVYVLIHLPRLSVRPTANPVEAIATIADTITVFYLVFFGLLFLIATFLMQESPLPSTALREPFYLIVYAALLVVCLIGVKTSNLDSIRADIFYKQGLNFDNNRQWDGSIAMYREAISLAPDQDFYYLFYGRAFLERAKVTSDPKQRADLLEMARKQLSRARDLNPLNTDHTANLARLYRTWAEVTSDQAQRVNRLNESLKYYQEAQALSPHNAQIINEYGSVYALMGQPDKALAKYNASLQIDAEFGQTYLLLGDLYQSQQDYDNAIANYQKAIKFDPTQGYNALGQLYINRQDYDNAIRVYQQALQQDPNFIQAHSALGLIYSRQNKLDLAINENLIVLGRQPNDYATLRNLMLLYQQAGKPSEAMQYAQRALAIAPEQDKPALQQFIAQLQGQK